ncbi:hypothetical protein D3C71_1873950 [compost metagenome]
MCFNDFDFGPFGQTVDPVRYHAIACGKARADDHSLAVLNARFHQMFADFIVTVQYPNKVAFVAHLQRRRWDHHRILFGSDQHARVDELVREQGVILIGKAGFKLDSAGRGIDLVIQAQ